jgi:hypothetical protein
MGDSWPVLIFETLFALSLSASLVLGELVRKQVNRALRDAKKAEIYLPWPHSIRETILGTHMWGFLGDLLEQHSRYYPASSLRKAFIVTLVGTVPAFIGLLLSALIFR